MKISSTIITFRIDIDFDGCDVDMVLKEMISRGVTSPVPSILADGASTKIDKKKLPKTPKESTVDFALYWLYGFVDRNRMCTQNSKWDTDYSKAECPKVKTELEELGIEVISIYGLMQGCCHLICECDISIFNNDLIEKSKEIVKKVFKKFVKYYKIKNN